MQHVSKLKNLVLYTEGDKIVTRSRGYWPYEDVKLSYISLSYYGTRNLRKQ